MIRPVTLFALGALASVALGLYLVADSVKEQERVLAELREEARRDRHAITVLKAEWAFLNEPRRLQRLAGAHLDLSVTDSARVGAWGDIPAGTVAGDPAPQTAPMPEQPDLEPRDHLAVPAALAAAPPLPGSRPDRPQTLARAAKPLGAEGAKPPVPENGEFAGAALVRQVGAVLALVAARKGDGE